MSEPAVRAMLGGACSADQTGCTLTCGGNTFSLAGFAKNAPPEGWFHAVDAGNHDYWFPACSGLSGLTCQPDSGSTVASTPADEAILGWAAKLLGIGEEELVV